VISNRKESGLMIDSIHHTSFTVTDLDRSIGFYRDILGMKLVWDSSELGIEFRGPESDRMTGCPGTEQRIAFMSIGGDLIELVQYTPLGKPLADNQASDTGSGHVCFLTKTIQELYERLSAKGMQIHCEPQAVGAAKVMYFRDPDGIILEAMEGEPPV
jgi:catechol 2,3-dioxygenase-like lactoylglutathione lyase family enzyme